MWFQALRSYRRELRGSRRGGHCLTSAGLVIALFILAIPHGLTLLGVVLLQHERRLALRASFGNRLVTEDGVAGRVVRATVEDFPSLRFLDDDLALAARPRTSHAGRLALDELAFRIVRAGRVLPRR